MHVYMYCINKCFVCMCVHNVYASDMFRYICACVYVCIMCIGGCAHLCIYVCIFVHTVHVYAYFCMCVVLSMHANMCVCILRQSRLSMHSGYYYN